MPLAKLRPVLLVAAALTLLGASCSAEAGGDDRSNVRSSTTASSSDGSGSSTSAAPTTEPARDPADVEAEPSAGCGTPPDVEPAADERPGDVPLTFTSGDVERVYRLAVPDDYDPDTPVPLVLNLHGSGSDAVQQSAYTALPAAGTDRGMIVAAPEGLDGLWELAGEGADDDFLVALTDDLESRYCIDRNRVHLAGMSLGAWKSGITGCANPNRFASVALVTVEVFPGTCDPLAVLAFHGTDDSTVPYDGSPDGGPGLPGTPENMASWAENGGCDAEPELSTLGDDVTEHRYLGCDEGVDVVLYEIEGGGHTWPGSDIKIGPTTETIDATELALDWFEAHPLR